jgi:Tol biopolymer transport system component
VAGLPPLLRPALAASLALCLAVGAAADAAAEIEHVSVAAGGGQPDGPSFVGDAHAVSLDGQRVVFSSMATNLVAGDTNACEDVFVRHRGSGTTERVSEGDTEGEELDRCSGQPAISAAGRHVAFRSLVSGAIDTGDDPDIFVRDLETDTTERVSVDGDGVEEVARFTSSPSISADGLYVAFATDMQLHVADTNTNIDVYVRDRNSGTTEWITSASSDHDSVEPAISSNGRYVSFTTSAALIPADDDGGQPDAYVYDRDSDSLELASVGDGEPEGDLGTGDSTAISADGRSVAFTSGSTNLVPGDTNDAEDVFVRDLAAGTTERVSVGGANRQVAGGGFGSLTMSDDAHFVTFLCGDDSLVPGQFAFGCVRDRERRRTRTLREEPGVSYVLSPDGHRLAFASLSRSLPGGGNGFISHVYVADFPPSSDAVPPELDVPDQMTVEAVSEDGTVVDFEETATDDTDPTPGVHCDPPSGEQLPLGATEVQCVAADEAGNEDTGSFTVTVQDTTPPRLDAPEAIELDPTGPDGAFVDYDNLVVAEDLVDGEIEVECEPDSESTFAIGPEEVLCSATDEADNTANHTIAVRVREGPAPELSISDMRVVERVGVAQLQVSLNQPASSEIDLQWDTVEDSAEEIRDYVPNEGSETIPEGGQFAFIDLELNRDRRDEGDESFQVQVTSTGGQPPVTGKVTIVDDDGPPPVGDRGTTNGPIVFAGQVDQLSGILKVDPATGGPVEELVFSPFGFFATLSDPSVSPDGESVLYVFETFDGEVRRQGLAQVDVDGGQPRQIDVEDTPSEPVWRPDGDAFAYIDDAPGARIKLVDLAEGTEEVLASVDENFPRELSWSPDGLKLAYSYSDQQTASAEIGVVDALDGFAEPLTQTPDCEERSPSWSPEGSQIAVSLSCGGGDQTIGVLPAAGGEATPLPIDDPGTTHSQPTWSPDGQRIAFIRELGDSIGLWSVAADGSDLTRQTDMTLGGDPDWGPSTEQGPDVTPPQTTILTGPRNPTPTSNKRPTFTFTSNEPGSSFECRVDGTVFPDCVSPFRTAELSDGPHTFDVRATDAAGNPDDSAAGVSFTVDTVPPNEATIVSGPDARTNAATATFTFSGEAGTTFLCSLDGGPAQACTSPFTTPALAPGEHRFEVRSVDAAQNLGPTVTRTWTIVLAGQEEQPPPPPPPPPPDLEITLADLPNPELGVDVNVQQLSGVVLVGVPAGAATIRRSGGASQKGVTFVPLTEARQIPVGSFLDTSRGAVRLQSASDASGTRQEGDFSRGLFQVLQSRRSSARGLTDIVLKGGSFSRARCGVRGRSSGAAASQVSRRVIRRVRSNAQGRFRTRGRHSAATVRGTVWETTDRCDGTLTKVTRGSVAVRDFRRRRTIVVRAGKRTRGPGGGRGSYLARAR